MRPPSPKLSVSLPRRWAGRLADSSVLAPARRLVERNFATFHLPLSTLEKVTAGSYLILRDYSDGLFPPTFADQQAAYQAEMDYYGSMSGVSRAEVIAGHVVKPFWSPAWFSRYSREFVRLWRVLGGLGLKPGQRLLELGCGSGWMAEFLALAGYAIVGTTIGPEDITMGLARARALVARGLPAGRLDYRRAPMESVDSAVADLPPFDAVFVFEALHHAFDWRRAIQSAARCLKPGGWLLLANEPNRLHTCVSYRVARLSNTHEIGMSGPALREEMRRAGLEEIRTLAPRLDLWIGAHWIAGRRPV